VQVCGVRSGRAILLTSAAAGIAIGIELHLARQILGLGVDRLVNLGRQDL